MPDNKTATLPSAYLAPIQYYSKLVNYNTCIIDTNENFVKQSCRSRCFIYSPNGVFTLSVPLVKRNSKKLMKEVKISYDFDWRLLHWRTLEASYRSSPFFEFFEDELRPYYFDKKYDYLIDLNESLQNEIIGMLQFSPTIEKSIEYVKISENADDYRSVIGLRGKAVEDPLFVAKPYIQVFESKHGFLPNLSILDLLFNQGNRGIDILTNS